jgi:hypothetical protein
MIGLRKEIILADIPIQSDSAQGHSPFLSLQREQLPLSLYFDILCQRLNVPDEMTIFILALIDRYFRFKAYKELYAQYDSISP